MSQHRPEDMLLVAYLDGELPEEVRLRVEALARADPDVHRRIIAMRRSGELLQAAMAERHFATEGDRLARLVGSLVHEKPTRRLRRSMPLLAACILGLVAGAAVSLVALRPVSPSDQIASILDEIADYHAVFARETDHLVEVPASRKAELEDWLSNRVGLRLAAPDLSPLGLRFEGGRMLVVDGQPIAQLMYSGPNNERVALCVSRISRGGPNGARSFRERGLHLEGRRAGDHLFVVAGDVGNGVVDQLADRLPELLSKS